ncbi:MAG: hypothetical protein EF806_02800 [Candidatus Methanoliparum thermophilum]|uniref:Uncharacterized protein n=1 Tax=Methanoliparum thermophilum TaxID=2491083 RepID=A0A520KST6_METT2|nr:hypothetical protein [Candidatus Methanoliparum sp. LAM-1]RZN64988.1 MAG: hypothetical protein EF806_02800 [Candidatus Methanoliparum thermophilum]BDC36127.1 hypothetical protein MTLP_08090 [Candidatus Methanoliparum sp. LAM-1]
MRILPIIIITGLIIFFCLPIVGGYADLPTDLSPDSVGNFLGGVTRYWISLKDIVMQAINPSTVTEMSFIVCISSYKI